MSKAGSVIEKVIAVIAAVFFAAVFVLCALDMGIVACLSAIAAFVLLALLCKAVARASDKLLLILFALLFCGFCFVLYNCAMQLKIDPSWDFGRVYFGVQEMIKNNTLAFTGTYFLESNNNLFAVFWIENAIRLFALFGSLSVIDGGIILNVISIASAVLLIFLAAKNAVGIKTAFITSLLCFGCAPLYTYSSIFYTDTLSMPFAALCAYLIVKGVKKCGSRAGGILLGILLGLSSFIGYKLKANVIFVCIAALIVWLLAKERKKHLRFIVTSALAFAVCFAGYSIWLGNSPQILDMSDIDEYRLPPMHYVMMGLHGSGGFNGDDYISSIAIPGAAAKTEAAAQEIDRTLREYGASGLVQHTADKIVYTWNDGLYYSAQKLGLSERIYTLAHSFAHPGGLEHDKLVFYANMCQWLLLASLCVSSVLALIKRDGAAVRAARIAVLGLGVFLLVWETRSRYLVNFIPLMLFCEASFFCGCFCNKEKLINIKKSALGQDAG